MGEGVFSDECGHHINTTSNINIKHQQLINNTSTTHQHQHQTSTSNINIQHQTSTSHQHQTSTPHQHHINPASHQQHQQHQHQTSTSNIKHHTHRCPPDPVDIRLGEVLQLRRSDGDLHERLVSFVLVEGGASCV